MTNARSGRGIALRLSAAGRVEEVLIDGLSLFEPDAPLANIRAVVDESSRAKLDAFLQQVVDHGSAHDWELTIASAGSLASVTFSGRRQGDGSLVIVGGASASDLEQMYEDLLRVNNEQTNLLRETVRELASLKRSNDPTKLDDMMQLNNELAGLQRELARQNRALERTNEQKNQLLGMVAHDLRNPLGVVTGYAEIMLQGLTGELTDRQRDFLDGIARSSKSMLTMVEELVDFSAIEAGKVQLDRDHVDLDALLRDAVRMSRVFAEQKSITVELSSPGAVVIDADAGKLRQVVTNLLSNAVKYSHESTTVRVILEREGDAIRVAVSDEGQGIPDEELGGIFQPFGRTSVKATAGEKSTGLGLAIVKKIVQAHGGTIDVTSTVGEGSTFELVLPND